MPDSLKAAIDRAVKEADPKLSPIEPEWTAAAFLFASALIGCDPDQIAKVLEADSSFIHTMAHRARTAKIWVLETIASDRWEEEAGGVQFWIDVAVLTGDMLTDDGENFRLSASARRRMTRLLGLDAQP